MIQFAAIRAYGPALAVADLLNKPKSLTSRIISTRHLQGKLKIISLVLFSEQDFLQRTVFEKLGIPCSEGHNIGPRLRAP